MIGLATPEKVRQHKQHEFLENPQKQRVGTPIDSTKKQAHRFEVGESIPQPTGKDAPISENQTRMKAYEECEWKKRFPPTTKKNGFSLKESPKKVYHPKQSQTNKVQEIQNTSNLHIRVLLKGD